MQSQPLLPISYSYYLLWGFISVVLTNTLFSDQLAMRPHQNPAKTAIFPAMLKATNDNPVSDLVIHLVQVKYRKIR
jgi:hypothetical protein